VFNFVVKENAKTSEEYIINAYSYMLKDQTGAIITCQKFLIYFFKAYTSIWQMSSKNSEWRENIHGTKKHEVGGDWEGGGLLWTDLEVGSWFINTNHI